MTDYISDNDNLKNAAEIALDEIAKSCGCPNWDYAGQVVRDVKRMLDERNKLALERDRYEVELGLLRATVRRVAETIDNLDNTVVVMDDEDSIECVRIETLRSALTEHRVAPTPGKA